ncbi:hypothetical protein BCAR13_80189 [Paraburkholderia caribensis]|nr:hypothetical protein BCAR13_80189 [Paraburkholderia caribensis]
MPPDYRPSSLSLLTQRGANILHLMLNRKAV